MTLSHFISRSSNGCKPFFQAIRNKKGDVRGQKQREAFEQLKKYLTSSLVLAILKQREALCLYLTAREGMTSVVLFREEGAIQRPIFYVSKSLTNAEKEGECEEIAEVDPSKTNWELYVGGWVILISLEGVDLECSVRLDFPASNNVVEYEVLILGLKLAKQLKISRITVHSDSQLIVGQTNEEYTTKDARTEAYHELAKGLANGFTYFE